ncbi:hypothetical protein ONZ51_g7774 [Trametes cubensis]|uniref:Uncharacterized protein n=1 Tax=Trametes cubensis TaxID=1111947 RepID=A0AAD7TPU7_9APHY|nr:hypothetical protein ONZ51_g7774 [Trametes cubensis]
MDTREEALKVGEDEDEKPLTVVLADTFLKNPSEPDEPHRPTNPTGPTITEPEEAELMSQQKTTTKNEGARWKGNIHKRSATIPPVALGRTDERSLSIDTSSNGDIIWRDDTDDPGQEISEGENNEGTERRECERRTHWRNRGATKTTRGRWLLANTSDNPSTASTRLLAFACGAAEFEHGA